MRNALVSICFGLLLTLGACGKPEANQPATTSASNDSAPSAAPVVNGTDPVAGNEPAKADEKPPVVKIAWSYYTSWSWFAAAEDFGLINSEEGQLGTLEKAQNVDIVLQRTEYVDSMNLYAAGTVDAVFLTNTDALATAQQRFKVVKDVTVGTMGTSYSDGADQIIGTNDIKTWADLKGVPVKGAEGSVTQFLFWSACNTNKVPYDGYTFENLDPTIGAAQFVGRQEGMKAFGGWSPETFTVLDGRDDVHALFTSAELPKYAITDMLIMGQSALDRGGDRAVKVVALALAKMNELAKDPTQQKQVYTAFTKRFNDLPTKWLERALKLTPVASPTRANDILDQQAFKDTMPNIQEFSKVHKLTDGDVSYAWGAKDAVPANTVVRFDTSYLP